MAAILCKGMAQACDGVGQILCIPCKACGMACGNVCEVMTSPFFPYLAITFALNAPCVYLGIVGSSDQGCAGNWTRWFLVNVALAVGHLVASVYIVHRIREDQAAHNPAGPAEPAQAAVTGVKDADTKIESGTYYSSTALPGEPNRQNSVVMAVPDEEPVTAQNSFARMKQVLCYDVGVAIYIVGVVIWCIWQTVGVSTLFGASAYETCDQQSKLVYSLICGFLYMSLAGIGFACSLCCLR